MVKVRAAMLFGRCFEQAVAALFRHEDPAAALFEQQDTVMALSQNRTPEIVAPDVARFVSSLATAWRAGEVRPTHRQEPKPGHWWRTRPDPFAEVWPVLLSWLEERPDM